MTETTDGMTAVAIEIVMIAAQNLDIHIPKIGIPMVGIRNRDDLQTAFPSITAIATATMRVVKTRQ